VLNITIAVGVGLGLSFIEPSSLPDLSGMQDIPNHISIFMQDMPGLSMPSLDFARVESEWLRLRNSIQIPEVWKLARDGREFKVGEEASARGLSAKFPVVLVPGVISYAR
jgi:phospholipid:diacylglycerol acyltransferase